VTYVDKTVPIEFPAKKKNTKAWHIYTTGSIYICTNFLQKLRLKIILKLYTKMTFFWCVRTTWQNCPLVYMYLTFAISILNLQYRDWILTSKRKYTYEWTIDARSCWFCENIYIYYICAGLWIPREYDFLLKMHENEGYIIHHMTILSAPSCLCISVRFVCFHDSVSKTFTLLELHYISYGVMAVEWVDLR